MPKIESFGPSSKSDKKYMVVLRQESGRKRTVHFGAKGMDDYTKTGDVEQKSRYIERHKDKENWNDPMTAGFWAKHILWNKPTVQSSLAETKRNFNL
jgi:hypothetical protein